MSALTFVLLIIVGYFVGVVALSFAIAFVVGGGFKAWLELRAMDRADKEAS